MESPSPPPSPLGRALALTVRWGASVLHVEQVSPPRAWALGEAGDLRLPPEVLGGSRVEVVRVRADRVFVVSGGQEHELGFGDEHTTTVGEVVVTVGLGERCARARRAGGPSARGLGYHVLSCAAHVVVIGVASVAAAPPASAALGGIEAQRALLERHAGTARLSESSRMATEVAEDEGTVPAAEADTPGGGFEPPRELVRRAPSPRGLEVVKERPASAAQRLPSYGDPLRDLRGFGLVELLGELEVGPPPVAWAERPSASDVAARHLWEPGLGSIQGLTLSGAGEGSGAPVAPRQQTLGAGEGGLRSSSDAGLDGTVRARQKLAQGATGRACFTSAVAKQPTLAGVVKVRLSIAAGGGVTSAADAGSDLPDAGVVSCVVGAFAKARVDGVTEAVSLTHTVRFGAQ